MRRRVDKEIDVKKSEEEEVEGMKRRKTRPGISGEVE